MAHYAFLDQNNRVVEVITGKDETDDGVNWEEFYSDYRGLVCKRTSYNTFGGVHLDGGIPFRKNYAGLGHFYDAERDAFIAPQPFQSWVLDEESCLWQPPIPYPNDGLMYTWNEDDQDWEAYVEQSEA